MKKRLAESCNFHTRRQNEKNNASLMRMSGTPGVFYNNKAIKSLLKKFMPLKRVLFAWERLEKSKISRRRYQGIVSRCVCGSSSLAASVITCIAQRNIMYLIPILSVIRRSIYSSRDDVINGTSGARSLASQQK